MSRLPAGLDVDVAPSPVEPSRVVTDTTELRWFAPGPPPADALAWFGHGAVEERCDTYRIADPADRGVKRRHGHLLELKARQAVDDVPVDLGGGLTGRPEAWRRWSPAEHLVELSPNDRWVDVAKRITRRRFLAGGVEVPFEPAAPAMGCCDAEITRLRVNGDRWWSLALAAYGPPEERHELIRAAWAELVAAAPLPAGLQTRLGDSRGYPAWLSNAAGRVATPTPTDIGSD